MPTPSLKPLNQQTIVITGASSGIGLATAQSAARLGAKVVLTSRDGAALDSIAKEIEAKGGRAISIAGDVADKAHMDAVAEKAISAFGGFDTWVNNAGISIYGKLEEVSEDDHRRLFETNFWGLVHGSLTAAKHLKVHGGALINLGSVASDVSFPLQGMYCASKAAIRGFTDAFRMELDMENAPVSVTLIKPGAINTPFPQHAKNYLDKEPKLPPPVYEPEEVAHAILHAAVSPVRDVHVGGSAKAMSLFNSFAPSAMDQAGASMAGMQLQDRPAAHALETFGKNGGNGRNMRVRGDHPGFVMPVSLYTRAVLHPVATSELAAAAYLLVRGGSRSARYR